jgi:acyl-CoA thioesterase I
MIIMRRIILATAALALTACGGELRETDPGTAGDGVETTSPGGFGRNASGDAATRGSPATPPSSGGAARTVLFVGTSLTAGYGVGPDVAYPALIQQRIDEEGLPFRVVNAGISGETSAGGLRRIDWSLQQPVDVLVVELGANDGLRGLDPEAMRRNIDEILARARELHPDIALVILGMQAPPNLGERYTNRFRAAYRTLAREHGAELVPFLLDGVAGDPSLNTDDGIHPNEEGHQVMAETVWRVLGKVLRGKMGG